MKEHNEKLFLEYLDAAKLAENETRDTPKWKKLNKQETKLQNQLVKQGHPVAIFLQEIKEITRYTNISKRSLRISQKKIKSLHEQMENLAYNHHMPTAITGLMFLYSLEAEYKYYQSTSYKQADKPNKKYYRLREERLKKREYYVVQLADNQDPFSTAFLDVASRRDLSDHFLSEAKKIPYASRRKLLSFVENEGYVKSNIIQGDRMRKKVFANYNFFTLHNYQQAYKLYSELCLEHGDPLLTLKQSKNGKFDYEVYTMTGVCFLLGKGVTRSLPTALKYFKEAYEMGYYGVREWLNEAEYQIHKPKITAYADLVHDLTIKHANSPIEEVSLWPPFAYFQERPKIDHEFDKAVTDLNNVAVTNLLNEGADPNRTLISGLKPIVVATKARSLQCVRVLLSFGADPNVISHENQTVLNYALSSGEVNLVEILLRYGADPNFRSSSRQLDYDSLYQKMPYEILLPLILAGLNLKEVIKLIHANITPPSRKKILVKVFSNKDVPKKVLEYWKQIEYNTSVEGLHQSAKELLSREEPAQALEKYQAILKEQPLNYGALLGEAESYLLLENYSKAINCYRYILKKHPDDPEPRLLLASVLLAQKDYNSALREARYVFEKDQKNVPSILLIGRIYYGLEQYEKAKEFFQLKLEQDPNDTEILDLQYKTCIQLNDYETAYQALLALHKLNPNRHDNLLKLAQITFMMKMYDRSVEYYNACLKLKPEGLQSICSKAEILIQQLRHGEALEALNTALTLDSKCTYAYKLKSDILFSQENFFEAQKLVETGLKVADDKDFSKVSLLKLRAQLFNAFGDKRAALESVDQAIKLNRTQGNSLPAGAQRERSATMFNELVNYRKSLLTNATQESANQPKTSSGLKDPAHLKRNAPSAQKINTPGTARKLLSESLDIPFEKLVVGDLLGRGGFGVVYSGTWKPTIKYSVVVAIKKLNATNLTEKVINDFKNEVQVHAKLDSSYIVQLYGIAQDNENSFCMVMEYMPHNSLDRYLHGNEQADIAWHIRIKLSWDIAAGLDYLHRQNPPIIHADLKSLNILLGDEKDKQSNLNVNKHAKLADFGLASIKNETKTQTVMKTTLDQSGRPEGTLLWMAPELFKRGTKQNKASDVYALGVVLREISNLSYPFAEEIHKGIELVMNYIRAGDLDPLSEGTPEPYSALATQCNDLNPKNRPSTVSILEALGKMKSTYSKGDGALSRRKDSDNNGFQRQYQLQSMATTSKANSPNYQLSTQGGDEEQTTRQFGQ